MNKPYVIGWKCQTNGRIGQGKTLMDFEEAERLADELNQAHPEYKHVPVLADSQDLASILTKAVSTAEMLPTLASQTVEPGSDGYLETEEEATLVLDKMAA